MALHSITLKIVKILSYQEWGLVETISQSSLMPALPGIVTTDYIQETVIWERQRRPKK